MTQKNTVAAVPAESKVGVPLLVRAARAIRHAPGLRAMRPLWDLMRPRYHRALSILFRNHGVPISIPSIGQIRVPASFLAGDVDPLELPMLEIFAPLIRADSCFYDLGASVGLHTLVAGTRIGPAGQIHAFEPDAASCSVFWRNTEILRRQVNVVLSQCFVSQQTTVDTLASLAPTLTQCTPGQHLYLFDRPVNDSIQRIRLDDYIRMGNAPPTILKCDIEGAELEFLRGAESCLRLHRPVMFISLHPDLIGRFGSTTQDFYEFLAAHGYTCEILNTIGETHVLALP